MAKEKKSMGTKKGWLGTALVAVILCVIVASCGGSSDDSKTTEEPKTTTQTEQTETTKETEQEETDPTMADYSDSKNLLLAQTVTEVDVMNGTGTEVLGTRRYIHSDSSVLSGLVTQSDFIEFYETRVKGSGVMWYTVFLEDDTALILHDGEEMAWYSETDSEGEDAGYIGYFTWDENGKFKFTDCKKIKMAKG